MLDKLKSLFIVEEEDNKKDKQEKKENPSKENKKSLSQEKTNIQKPQGSLNEKIMTKLLTVLSENNLDGFDYIEFKNSIKALEKMQMDEKTKYRSAFATAQTIGLTREKLLESIAYYQKVLNKENDEFLKALNSQVNVKVGDKKKELQGFDKMIKDKTLQIQRLQKEIEKHKEVQKSLSQEIEKDTVHIERTRSDFETTFFKLMHQIKEDVKKINEYLQ